jgi:hypothetical protein
VVNQAITVIVPTSLTVTSSRTYMWGPRFHSSHRPKSTGHRCKALKTLQSPSGKKKSKIEKVSCPRGRAEPASPPPATIATTQTGKGDQRLAAAAADESHGRQQVSAEPEPDGRARPGPGAPHPGLRRRLGARRR